ncbi:MAG: NAD(P)-dependent oxidoreductase [Anaerolineae bacterium]|nr:NAD(P)-dependent oxidoreductase [Anaerolineae bacterium]
MKKVLVTGANGFIGTALTERLLRDGVEVRAMCRNVHNGDALKQAGAEVVGGDLMHPDVLRQHAEGCEVVFHVGAALGGTAAYQYNVSVLGTRNMAQAASDAGVGRFVHVSTISVYGTNVYGSIDEDRAQLPSRDDYYQQSKSIAEKVLRETASRTGLPITIMRPGMVYGPGSNFWTRMLYQTFSRYPVPIFGDGKGTAHPIFIDDAVDLLITLATHPAAVGEAFNCAPDPAPTWVEFLDFYARMGGNTKKMHISVELLRLFAPMINLLTRMRGEPTDMIGYIDYLTVPFVYSMRRAADKLGWRAQVSLPDGMAQAERWLKSNVPLLT